MNAITITCEFTIPRIARAGRHPMPSVCIPVLICTVMLVFGFLTHETNAQARCHAATSAAQARANDKPGSRRVPAKVIPVPSELDPGTAALVAAPYSKIWNLNPPNDAAWRVVQKQAADQAVPMLAKTRAELGVSIEATSVGGV